METAQTTIPSEAKPAIADVQNKRDLRNISIGEVGITDLTYPIVIGRQNGKEQHTIAKVQLVVNLPHFLKGTHMSRLVEVLNEHHKAITVRSIPEILEKVKERIGATYAKIEIEFPYFIERTAPVSKRSGYVDCECKLVGESNCQLKGLIISVKTPITSLCPCSKEISQYGAHNQRGHVNIEVKTDCLSMNGSGEIDFDELIGIATESGSAPIYSILKRADERFVTMQAYENPAFVEDIVRNISVRLKELHQAERISWFLVKAINYESIHNHNAFASVEWPS